MSGNPARSTIAAPCAPSRDAGRALDWLNVLIADVEGGVGPFLAIYFTATRHWNVGSTGLVLTVGGLATVAARGPLGGLVDRIRWKRGLIIAAALMVAATTLMNVAWPSFWPVMLAQTGAGIAAAAFPPAIAAISLGLVGRQAFTAQIGRNEAFNHAGNVATAILAGLAGWVFAPVSVLWMVAALSVVSIAAVLTIDPRRIDHALARGADDGAQRALGGVAAVFRLRGLAAFAAAVTLFHFANAAMLPLLGEKLAAAHLGVGSLFMGACIIIAQMTMVPMAIMVGRRADCWGRKPIFLAGLAVLPLRGVLYTLTNDPALLMAIQILDGVGAGIFGALFPVVVADLTKGTGHYNLSLGMVGACWGFGAALSNAVAGYIVDVAGYDAAFMALAACALAAPLVYLFAVPETRLMPEATHAGT